MNGRRGMRSPSRRIASALATAACAALAAAIAVAPRSLAAQNKPNAAAPPAQPDRFGFGRPATESEIAAWDIDVRPDGTGLPPGQGTPVDGEPIYAARCSGCHGKTGREGPNDVLVGRAPDNAFRFSEDPKLQRTIGSYWPYATTVFDYIRRAMPPDRPGSLTDNEIYAVVAYLLRLNELIPADAVMDRTTLPKVAMPSRDRFVPDTRGRDSRRSR
jgi:cytochrome c